MKENEYTEQQDLFGDLFEQEEQNTPAQAQPSSPSPEAKTEAPVCHQVDTAALIGTLNRTGSAKLSDHFVKEDEKEPSKEPEAPESGESADAPETGGKTAKKGKSAKAAKMTKEEKTAQAKKKEEEQLIATDGMAAYLKDFLDKAAAENPEFAKVYANPNKSLKECVEYVCSEIFKDFHKAGICTVRNDAIEGKALHYYQEDDCKPNIPQGKNIAMAVLLQGMPIPAEDFDKIQAIARREQRKDIIEEEKKKYADQVRSGEVKLELTDDEQAEIDAAARQALVDASAERQKKNTARRSQANPKKETHEEAATLF
jgi:hypothetical protein